MLGAGYSNLTGRTQNNDNENNGSGEGVVNNGREEGVVNNGREEGVINNGRDKGDENNDSDGGDENIESDVGERDQVMERLIFLYQVKFRGNRGQSIHGITIDTVSNGVFWQNMSLVETGVVSEIITTNILKNMTSQVCRSQHR